MLLEKRTNWLAALVVAATKRRRRGQLWYAKPCGTINQMRSSYMNIICQAIWCDRSGQVHCLPHLTPYGKGWLCNWWLGAHLCCRNNVRHSICLSTFNAYQEQNTVWENYQRNCHVILFTLRQNIEFLAFRSICVYERLCVRLSPLLLPLMNLCSWVTVRLFSRFSAAFRNFCPSPSECTGGKHLPGISFYMCKCFHQIISDKIKYFLYS